MPRSTLKKSRTAIRTYYSWTKTGLNRVACVERIELMLERARDRSVLHIGCTGGPIDAAPDEVWSRELPNTVHARLTRVASTITGLDINERRLQRMGSHLPGAELLYVDITCALPPALAGRTFDVVFLAEVIEHLTDLSTMFGNLGELMHEGSELIITTPNAHGLGNVVRALAGREKNHPEHVAYYSYVTLTNLIRRYGFEPSEFFYVKPFAGNGRTARERAKSVLYRVIPQLCHGLIMVVHKAPAARADAAPANAAQAASA